MRGTHHIGHLAAWLVAACAAIGCTSVPTQRHQMDPTEMTVALPASAVAWLVAETVRGEYRGSDPAPYRAGAPILVDGDRLQVRYERRAPDAFRVVRNARIRLVEPLAPTAPLLCARIVERSPTTGVHGAADDAITLTVHSLRDESRLVASASGTIDLRRSFDRVRSVVHAGESLERAMRALADDRPDLADQLLAATSASLTATGQPEPLALRARLHLARALVAAARDDAAPALAASTLAAALDPSLRLANWIQSRFERTLARDGRSNAALHGLALRDDGGDRHAFVRLARTERRRALSPRVESPSAQLAELTPANADVQSRRFVDFCVSTAATLSALGDRQRSAGLRRRAFETGLEAYARSGGALDADALLDLHDDALASGEPLAALRLLGRHHATLAASAPERFAEAISRAAARLPPDLAVRALLAVGADGVASTQWQRWLASEPDAAARAAIEATRRRVEREGIGAADLPATPPRR